MYPIGRIIEADSQNKIEVHEYGKDGNNIVDFSLIFHQFIKNKYDYTFILASDNDIVEKEPFSMGKGNQIPKKSFVRKLYDISSSIRYLNINQKLSVRLKKIFSSNINPKKIKNKISFKDINIQAFEIFDSTCIFL